MDGDTLETTQSNNQSTLGIPLTPPVINCASGTRYDLSLTKTGSTTTANPGDIVNFTFTVYNSGTSDKYVRLQDLINPAWSIVKKSMCSILWDTRILQIYQRSKHYVNEVSKHGIDRKIHWDFLSDLPTSLSQDVHILQVLVSFTTMPQECLTPSKMPMSHILTIIVAWDMEAEKPIKELCLMFLRVSIALPPTDWISTKSVWYLPVFPQILPSCMILSFSRYISNYCLKRICQSSYSNTIYTFSTYKDIVVTSIYNFCCLIWWFLL